MGRCHHPLEGRQLPSDCSVTPRHPHHINRIHARLCRTAGYVAHAEPGQPAGLPNLITQLAAGYISDKDTIIMCVCAGYQDFGSWSHFKEAEKCDPTRERTIVVITKLDCITTSTHVAQLKKNLDALFKYDSRPLDIVLVRFAAFITSSFVPAACCCSCCTHACDET